VDGKHLMRFRNETSVFKFPPAVSGRGLRKTLTSSKVLAVAGHGSRSVRETEMVRNSDKNEPSFDCEVLRITFTTIVYQVFQFLLICSPHPL